MNNPTKVILHCSASADTVENNYSLAALTKDHLARGFKACGYHFYITRDGEIHKGRELNVIGAHCKKHNINSIGVCYEGTYFPTLAQVNSLINIYRQLNQIFKIAVESWHGHKEFSNKICPGFEIEDFQAIIKKM